MTEFSTKKEKHPFLHRMFWAESTWETASAKESVLTILPEEERKIYLCERCSPHQEEILSWWEMKNWGWKISTQILSKPCVFPWLSQPSDVAESVPCFFWVADKHSGFDTFWGLYLEDPPTYCCSSAICFTFYPSGPAGDTKRISLHFLQL